ncbi:hypothetical protein [Mycolicibacterium sp. XJ1819]
MTRFLALCCALLLTLSVAPGCGSPPPALPAENPTEVHRMLTGDSATDFLTQIATYPWEDDGAAAGARFTWIGRDAASTDGDAASRASQAAAALTDFLLAEHNDLMSVRAGFLGLTKVPAAQLNPLLFRSFAAALGPFLSRMVDGTDPEFASFRDGVTANPTALRNVLTVLVAGTEAAGTIVESANSAAGSLEDAAATAPPGSQDSVSDLAAAGSMLGAVAGAAQQARTTGISPPVLADALNDLTVRIATALVRADPNPGTVSQYVRNGRLMTPDDVERDFGSQELQAYYSTLASYLTEKGFGEALSEFEKSFRTGSGETPHRPTA